LFCSTILNASSLFLHPNFEIMRNRISLFVSLFLSAFLSQAQVIEPARLTAETPSGTVKVGDELELVFKATIDKGWYIYSVDFDAECGPIPMTVTLEKHSSFELVGPLVAVKDKTKHDKIFDCDVRIFENTGEFRQKIRVLSPDLKLTGAYEGQVCSEVQGKCVLFDGDLAFQPIKVTGKAIKPAENKPGNENPSPGQEQAKQEPQTRIDSVSPTAQEPSAPQKQYGENKGPVLDPALLTASEYDTQQSLWGYMILAFILGLTSLITPCVFPMIPMTVTFFLKDGQTKKTGIRNALFFGISIIVIYTIAGTAFALIFGAEGLNALATHWLPNLFISALFIVFALSFLGLFEINAPYKLVNKADRAAEKGGIAGIFFMSATLVLVSFSCTIPLVGNVLVLAAGGEVIKPIMGMLAYSLAFAVPFTLFAMFPEWLKALPKSGGWLNSVKITLGLLELALALKFFSIADQTYHWGLLDREVNIAIWIVIFILLGFYFLGQIRFKSDSPTESLSVSRLLLAIATFSFVIYLIPGLWGAPLKALAGYLPPMHTHDFDLVSAARSAKGNEVCDDPKYADFLHLPHGLKGYFDYDQALACARQQQKPLFIDFTGHGCTNCREMEAVVWSDPQVLERLKNDFVVVALYVDDKTELPESEWYTSSYDNKVKKTIGKQNADLQIRNLNNNAQPFYLLVGEDERVMVSPYGYDKSVDGFVKFLEEGKKKYKELY
jgi:thiol:disulfide interchange protein DsbD